MTPAAGAGPGHGAELEAAAPRVACPEHGVVVAAVPWARHGAAQTRSLGHHVSHGHRYGARCRDSAGAGVTV